MFYFLRYKKILRFKTCGTLLILIRNTIFASSCDSCFLHLFGLISKSIKMCNQMGISRYEFLMPDKTLHNVSFIECNNESICIFPLIFRSWNWWRVLWVNVFSHFWWSQLSMDTLWLARTKLKLYQLWKGIKFELSFKIYTMKN